MASALLDSNSADTSIKHTSTNLKNNFIAFLLSGFLDNQKLMGLYTNTREIPFGNIVTVQLTAETQRPQRFVEFIEIIFSFISKTN